MATIPLPALHTAPIVQPPNQLEMLGQLMGIRGAQQNQQLREQEMQSGQLAQQDQQLKLQQDQQALKDQQAFRTAMQSPDNHGKTMGDIADTLANEGSISMQGWQQMKKADIDQRTALASLDEKSLANYKVAHAATQELYNNAMNMPDDQLTANWPAIAQQYNAIPGNQKVPLDPTQPMTKQQLQQFGPMLAMHGAYLDEATARRKNTAEAQTAEATLAQKQAESQFYQQNGGAPGVPAEVMQQADWLKKNPDDTAVLRFRANALLSTGQAGAARPDYEAALRKVPNDPVALNDLAWVIQDKDPKRALDLATRANQIAPGSPEIMDTLGWLQFRQGQTKAALDSLQRAHEKRATNPEIGYHLALVMNAAGQKQEAKALLQAVVSSGSGFADGPAAKATLAKW